MKLTFHLPEDSFYDCTIHIRDAKGARAYPMKAKAALGSAVVDTISVQAEGDSVEIVTLPKLSEALQEELNELEGDTLLKKLAVKTVKKAVSALYRSSVLHVAVTYRLTLKERIGTDPGGSGSIHLRLTERPYPPTSEWMSELFGFHPVCYAFFELSEGDSPLKPAAVRDLNGLEVIRAARKFVLMSCTGSIVGLLAYPFLMGQLKRQTRSRVILRKLKKLYRMSPEARAKVFEEFGGEADAEEF